MNRCRACVILVLGCLRTAHAGPERTPPIWPAGGFPPPPLIRTAPRETPPPAPAAPPAATVPFSGVVLQKGSRDPLGGLRVELRAGAPERSLATVTDPGGRFSFAAVPAGAVRVRISGGGIRSAGSTERLRRGARTSVTYYVLRPQSPFETVVRGEAVRKEVVEQVLSVEELKRIPGNNNDALKAVQNLPGVARAPFGGGLLVVWGSAPNDTRVYADGVFLPRLYHFGGLRATINSEFVTDLVFRPGAYSADYGRGLGGVVEISTRRPRSDRVHGSVTMDLIDGSLTLEAPITKKLHVAVGGRISWISAFLPLFNTSSFQISPNYWDYQVAVRYLASSRDDLDLFVFGSTDNLSARVANPDPNTSVDIDSKSYFSRARLRWRHRFGKDTLLTVMPSIGADTFGIDTGDGGVAGRQLKLQAQQFGYNLRAELSHHLHPLVYLAAGVDIESYHSSADFLGPGGGGPMSSGSAGNIPSVVTAAIRDGSTFDIVQAAPYLVTRIQLLGRRLLLSPQLRLELDYFRSYNGDASNVRVNPEPRLLATAQLVPGRLALKAALGVYHQPSQGVELTRRLGNPELDLQFGTTYVLGADIDATDTLHIETQGFYKDLHSMIVPDPVQNYSNGGLGRVYGGELLVRQRLWHNFFGWVSYTLSRSERRDRPDEPWHVFRFDQTHILTLVASYRLPFGLEAGVRFRYVTGNPYTPTVAGVRNIGEQRYEPILGARLSARLPDFHQLDLRIDKTFTFNRWRLGLYLDIQNLYNQANTEVLVTGGRQLYQVGRITGLPIFPNLGVRADF